jgi:hypothetical protein
MKTFTPDSIKKSYTSITSVPKDDLFKYACMRARGDEELFGFRKQDGHRVV